ncbi:hypothetical protein [Defluviimonas sp. WL0075]|uniref:Uncharacterized protein n=1 Tax=Albidovulum sediminicola TaxID=2984331 RepID=A0ABT2Z753_9RHOB|nr:hypothetical protein [Defluviimonas sp. WL0075]MCV2866968.1 hypothetical protein [Defluviimonas sp. WL0075]
MSDPAFDPLTAAALDAVRLLPAASAALYDLAQAHRTVSRSLALGLASRLARAQLSPERDLADLDGICGPLTAELDREWVREIHADPHCPSGSWVTHVRTREGAALHALSAPLLDLRAALRALVELGRAETLALRLAADLRA